MNKSLSVEQDYVEKHACTVSFNQIISMKSSSFDCGAQNGLHPVYVCFKGMEARLLEAYRKSRKDRNRIILQSCSEV